MQGDMTESEQVVIKSIPSVRCSGWGAKHAQSYNSFLFIVDFGASLRTKGFAANTNSSESFGGEGGGGGRVFTLKRHDQRSKGGGNFLQLQDSAN